MTARQVHAMIAAGVENPLLVTRWAAAGTELDLDALAKFAGLTVKVRHNGLRQDLPLTFRLLNVAGLEIEVFAAYAAFRAERGGRYAATTAERTHDLIAFLGDWLDRERPDHVLLWDLIRHEDAIARLTRSEGQTPPGPPAATPALRGTSVPHLRGQLVLHDMQSDPAVIAAVLREKVPPLDRVPFAQRHAGYWRPESVREIRVLELDEFGFYALSLVDGTRSVSDISHALIGTRRTSRAFLQLLAQLADLGILGILGT
jgi:hypothetical protein